MFRRALSHCRPMILPTDATVKAKGLGQSLNSIKKVDYLYKSLKYRLGRTNDLHLSPLPFRKMEAF